jgi:hypothetical protein
VAGWLREVTRGRANVHVAALHAGGDGRHLGRGVCYELNVLLCELLRRLEVPAAIATGWTFSGGALAEPDHLWAMALLPSPEGPRWLPLDAATTRAGRPLQLPRRPPGPWRVKPPRRASLPKGPRLEAEPKRRRRGRREGGVRAPGFGHSRPEPERPRALPIAELVRLARHLEARTGELLGDREELRRRFEDLLADPKRLTELTKLLQGKK